MSTRISGGKWYYEITMLQDGICEYCGVICELMKKSGCKKCWISKPCCKRCLEHMIISDIRKICLSCVRNEKINIITQENYEHE